jgi:hypothetical protein
VKEHRWIVAVIYRVSEESAAKVTRGEVVNLGHKQRIGVDGPGCLDCERTYEDAHGTLCNGLVDQKP